MLNIVIPMAGAGSRFSKEGYSDPKPLIPVNDKPMIQVVINNLTPTCKHRFIFICQKSHISKYSLTKKLNKWAPGCEIIGINGITDGAACTVLKANNYINNNAPLMIANSDQYVDIYIDHYLDYMEHARLDGLIMTMKADDPKWSFVKLDKDKMVTEVVEKKVVSDEATVGIYNFKKGSDFVASAEEMIRSNLRVNNEFYVAPAYNLMLSEMKNIGIYNIGKEADGMYGLGTPADLELFLQLPSSSKTIKKGK